MERKGLEPARLLVVDDDPILRELALAHLCNTRVTVELAADGREAWRRLCEGCFDIVLTDLDMPMLDGFELLSRIRDNEELSHLPVVVATGRNDMESVDRAYAAGATAFVLKPLNWTAVSYQLSYVLRNARENARIRNNARALRRRLRAQDEVLNICQDGIDRLGRVLLDLAPEAALRSSDHAPVTFSRLWTELEQLRGEVHARAGQVR